MHLFQLTLPASMDYTNLNSTNNCQYDSPGLSIEIVGTTTLTLRSAKTAQRRVAVLLDVLPQPVVDVLDHYIAVAIEKHFMHIAVDPDILQANKVVLHAGLVQPLGNANVEHAVIRSLR